MSSIYARLYRYRERQVRSPLEDFTSEALADFFNRLPLALQQQFIERLFLPKSLRDGWSRLQETLQTYTAETQHRISAGDRIDVLIFANSTPIIAIENKITASLKASWTLPCCHKPRI
jgi:hypothetical protein